MYCYNMKVCELGVVVTIKAITLSNHMNEEMLGVTRSTW